MSVIPRLGIIIVAGGSSSRYGKNKLFEELAGLPVILHSLRSFSPLAGKGYLVLVVPEKDRETFRSLCARHLPGCGITLAAGGDTRTASVRNGLAALPPDTEIAAIHDGARPLATGKLMRALVQKVRAENCGVIAAEKMIDSVCRADAGGVITESVPREDLRRIQTPQVFPFRQITEAYARLGETVLTDDSAVARAAGFPVMVLDNTEPNMKLTLPDDLLFMEFLLSEGKKAEKS